ncbi:uncharacterized protein LOC124464868 [Hypomesus transpacificus]|uniref:uncharacterized protein LOC124464868 n=1 Tax=Hypomesus transpacificus TaxID=137520 RepID=UPI001F07D9FC|nr:uncharacterized protein LOC124464868 [Hypomesus transpacificus]
MAHHLTESECDLFRRFKLTEEWTDSLEDVVLLSRASSFPAQAQASNSGPSDVMATYLCEEFKTFLEKRGTYKELENVISKVLLKIVQAKKADGSSLFVVKPNSTVEIPTEIVTSPVWKSKEPSLIARPTLRTESDILQNQQTSSDLQVEQQDEFGCSEDGTRNNIVKCLNNIAFDEFCHVKTNLRADVMGLRQTPRRCSSMARGTDSLKAILLGALSSLNRQTRREIALSQKLGMIVTPLPNDGRSGQS